MVLSTSQAVEKGTRLNRVSCSRGGVHADNNASRKDTWGTIKRAKKGKDRIPEIQGCGLN